MDDRIRTVAPEYSYADRLYRHEGRTIVRLTLDLQSGSVISAAVIQSSGFKTLDNSAVAALRHWRWKPGKWKQIDMRVKFQLGNVAAPLPPKAVRLPPPHS
jgi:TonB family protein